MTDKELAALLIRHAAQRQRIDPSDYAAVNAVAELRDVGNARVASMLQVLGTHAIVSDVQPTFTENGLGFAFQIDSSLVEELTDDQLIYRRIEGVFHGAPSETASTLAELLESCERSNVNAVYRDDLLASIKELQSCFSHECYIACLASIRIQFEDKWMIGKLISTFQAANLESYLDQSLPDIAKIINRSRIPAVHSVERIPVPSKAQAIMVIHAVVDTVNRIIVRCDTPLVRI